MMIATTPPVSEPIQRLADCIARRVAAAGGGHEPMEQEHIRELAHAVAWHVVEETGDAEVTPSEWLPRVCRALAACGAAETATLLMLFDTQLVRPAVWTFHGTRTFWILDCARLVPRETERTALLLDRSLSVILGRMAPLWDRDAGDGVLGLRQGDRLAEALADGISLRRRSRRSTPLNALRQCCADRLAFLARRRGWPQTPDVILLNTES